MKMHSFYCSYVQLLKQWMIIRICCGFQLQLQEMITDWGRMRHLRQLFLFFLEMN